MGISKTNNTGSVLIFFTVCILMCFGLYLKPLESSGGFYSVCKKLLKIPVAHYCFAYHSFLKSLGMDEAENQDFLAVLPYQVDTKMQNTHSYFTGAPKDKLMGIRAGCVAGYSALACYVVLTVGEMK